VTFDTGIGILANSRLEVKNDREFTRFTAKVGVDQNTQNTGDPVTFLLFADGRQVATSGPLKFGDQPVNFSANIGGAKIVEMVVRQARGTNRPVAVAWGNAALTK
jgi:alpha-galactosidase